MTQIQYHNRDVKDLGVHNTRGSAMNKAVFLRPGFWFFLPFIGLATYYLTVNDSDGNYIRNENLAAGYTALPELDISTTLKSPGPGADLKSNTGHARINQAMLSVDDINAVTPDIFSNLEDSVVEKTLGQTHTSGKQFNKLLQETPEKWKTVKIKSGDTLYIILKRLGLNTADATFIAQSENSRQLVKLVPGKKLHILSTDGNSSDQRV